MLYNYYAFQQMTFDRNLTRLRLINRFECERFNFILVFSTSLARNE